MLRPIPLMVSIIALGALTACGSTSSSILPTGSILGGSATGPGAQGAGGPIAVDPSKRPIQVGWVSARASKCGFYFAPDKLKAQYMAAEAASGLTIQQLKKLDLTYEYSRKATALRIAKAPDYCTDNRTAKIRKDLQRHLAGDYTPSKRPKVVPEKSFWDVGDSGPKKFNPDEAFSPKKY